MPKNTNLKKGPWSDTERAFVRDHYYELEVKEIAKRLKRSVYGVNHQILQLRQKGLIGYKSKQTTVNAVYTTEAIPMIASKKPWWKFW